MKSSEFSILATSNVSVCLITFCYPFRKAKNKTEFELLLLLTKTHDFCKVLDVVHQHLVSGQGVQVGCHQRSA